MHLRFALFLVALFSVLAGCGSSSGGGGAQAVTAAQGGDNPGGDTPAVIGPQSGDFLSYLPEQSHVDIIAIFSLPLYSEDGATADVVLRDGDRLYIGSGDTGITLVDISEPDALQVLGRYRQLTGTPVALYAQDGWLAAVIHRSNDDGNVGNTRLLVLDVAQPGRIQLERSLDLAGECRSSRLEEGTRLYLICTERSNVDASTGQWDPRHVDKAYSVDLRDARVIDALVLEDGPGSWPQRRVLFGEQHIYLATESVADEGSEGFTQLYALDVSDPSGRLVDGGQEPLPGLADVWMDEYRGTVRVVGPRGEQFPDDTVSVATFSLTASGTLQQQQSMDLWTVDADQYMWLGPVRFDGPTVYYALNGTDGSELLTVDLSDPWQPTTGRLILGSPNRIEQLELEDGRLFALGSVDGAGPSVTLIDVSDPSSPNLLDRYEFDGRPLDVRRSGWDHLDDRGRMLRVSFQPNTATESDSCERHPVGAVQFIALDPLRERLEPGQVLAGDWTAPSWFIDLADDRLLTVGGDLVQSLQLDNGAITPSSQVGLAHNVARALPLANGTVARFAPSNQLSFSTDLRPSGYRGQSDVDFAPAEAAEDPDGALGALDLYDCHTPEKELQTFARGDQLETLYYTEGGFLGLRIIDASDPARPQLLSDTRWGGYTQDHAHHAYGGGFAPTMVRTDHAIVVREGSALRVIDLRDPAAPASTVVNLPGAFSYGGLLADGDAVLTSHYEVQGGDENAARFYLDRISVAPGERPVVERPVNIPGEPLYRDRASGDLLTRQMIRARPREMVPATVSDDTGRECPGIYIYPFGRSGDQYAADCVIERLNLVSVADGVATLRDGLALEGPEALSQVAAGDGVVFALQSRDGGVDLPPMAGLMALSGFGTGQLEVEHSGLTQPRFATAIYAAGSRALLIGPADDNSIVAAGTEAGSLGAFCINTLRRYPQSVVFTEDGMALLSMGPGGLERIANGPCFGTFNFNYIDH